MTTEQRSPASCAESADLLAGAALDALSPQDELLLRRHLADCAPCAAELAELRAVAAALATAVRQVEPSPALGERIFSAAALERPANATGSSGLPRAPRPLAARLRASAAAWGAAAAILVALGSLAWAASLQAQVGALAADARIAQAEREKAARYDRVVRVLASPQLEVRQLEPSLQGLRASGTVYLDPASGSGMVMVHGLPRLPAGRAWQLWFVRGTQRVSGGMLWTDPNGTGYSLIALPADVASFDSIGITEEPATGSPAPTTPRVIGTRL